MPFDPPTATVDSATRLGRPRRELPPLGRWLQRMHAEYPARLSWKEVANQLDMSYTYLIQIKNGHEQPSLDLIARLEAFFQRRFLEDDPVSSFANLSDHYHLVPVYRGTTDHRCPTPLGAQVGWAPVENRRDPHRQCYFFVTPDNGLLPAIPRGSLCFTNPQMQRITDEVALLLLSREAGPAHLILARRHRGGCLLQTLPEFRTSTRDTPRGLQLDPQAVTVHGQVEEIRFNLPDGAGMSAIWRL